MTTASWRDKGGGEVGEREERKESVKERRGGVQEGGMEGRGGRQGAKGDRTREEGLGV